VSAGATLVAVGDRPTRNAARRLIAEYLGWLLPLAEAEYGLSFDVEAMVESDMGDRDKFFPPAGRFYVVRHAGAYAGVGCLKALAPGVAEIQRMYVQPHMRGTGAGRMIVERLVEDARAMDFRSVRLESLKFLSAAHGLYRSVGFVEIPPYTGNSMQDYQDAAAMDAYRQSAVFMELSLR
jgi:GNAT superfamily N-acetyltransferase